MLVNTNPGHFLSRTNEAKTIHAQALIGVKL